jgi:general secretion pathway protein H
MSGADARSAESVTAQAGFTLVELLVVLAIFGAITSLAVLRIGGSRDTQLAEKAAGTVAGTLKLARISAIQQGVPVRVEFDLQHGKIQTAGKPPLTFDPRIRIVAEMARPARAEEENGAAISFLPDGRSSGGIISVSVGKVVRSIRVNWLTGFVSEENHAAQR